MPRGKKKVVADKKIPVPEEPKGDALVVPDGAKIEGISSTPTKDQVAEMEADDELRKRSAVITMGFVALQLKGPDRYRIINKRRQWISGVLPAREAVVLANKLNMKDPEQKPWNRKPGTWGQEEAKKAY